MIEIGQEYISRHGNFHLRVIGFKDKDDNIYNPFGEYTITVFAVYSHIPLRNEVNGSMSPKILEEFYVLKTETNKLLYVEENDI